MVILGIETSCDDTAIAIIKARKNKFPRFKILSNVVSSQVKIHRKYGGVYPTLAKREHQKNLPIVLAKALEEAKHPNIDLMAVTVGPGLEPCLWVGVNFAKDLSEKWKIPLVPVNHIEGHILINFVNLNSEFEIRNPKLDFKIKNLFPAMALVVSGGHSQLILMKDIGKYKIIGQTRDDAAGECFDKTARILGLGYPGGPAIAAEAKKFQKKIKINKEILTKLPRPMIYQKNYDFSFSGLKTAVLYQVENERFKIKDKKYIQKMAFEIQQAIIDVLIHKTLSAAKEYKVKTIILGGGVGANYELRRQMKEKIKKEIPQALFLAPDPIFCTDNAVMIAVAGYFNWLKRKHWKKIEANANLKIEKMLR